MPRPKNKPQRRFRPSRGKPRNSRYSADSDRILLYGIHAVEAALANPNRTIFRLLATENAARRLETALKARGVGPEDALPKQLDRLLGSDAVHQGVVLETEPLPTVELEDVRPEGILLVLDQVTDPQNVGAVLRSAAAFGAAGVVMPERHTPPLTGALAKAASGALDLVPVILIGNLAQALQHLGEAGFLRAGLAEEGSEPLETAELSLPLALVLGAEGKGLRQLTREHCDRICRISTKGPLASLNVSNAAAIALHWAGVTARAAQ
ncbi:23S rRNA (guanosine(2251)-2'-O)-methyltransferase RlmB [Methyloceanibacter sp.]|uniref:23S rRNA (guanosine(2251)-2'-O)-methyltransferase RlmB n=1 Tax=Methyloceanibacter sp. TaxID=1965321 RepID=UPI003D6CC15C